MQYIADTQRNIKGLKTMTNTQLEKLSFYAKEEAMQFACLLEVGTHACLDEIRFTVRAGDIAYHVVKERYFKRFGYWKLA